MGSKQSLNYRRCPVIIFSKNCFWCKKNHQKIECFVDFWIFIAIYMDKLDQFKKNDCRMFRISWNITKMLKPEQFFHMWLFLFLKIRCLKYRKAYCSHNSKNKKCSVFNFLVIFQLILNVLQLFFLKLV